MTSASEAALWREHGRQPPARPLPPPSPSSRRSSARLPAAAWAPRLLVIECLATGAPLAAVARMLGLAGEDALAEVLRAARGFVVLSGYSCDLYDRDLYADWPRFSRDSVADGGEARTEVLWVSPRTATALGGTQERLFA